MKREYGNASFVKQTSGIEADLLLRLRPNMCLWGAPPPYCGKGRPKIHGNKFKIADSNTWGQPTVCVEIEDHSWGTVQIQHWSGLQCARCCRSFAATFADYCFGSSNSKTLPQTNVALVGLERRCLQWSRHGDIIYVGLPLTIGIDLLSNGYIGHFLTSVQPS